MDYNNMLRQSTGRRYGSSYDPYAHYFPRLSRSVNAPGIELIHKTTMQF